VGAGSIYQKLAHGNEEEEEEAIDSENVGFSSKARKFVN
jgi:hypothetical protein